MSDALFEEIRRAKAENYAKIYRSSGIEGERAEELARAFNLMYERCLADLKAHDESSFIFRHHIARIQEHLAYYDRAYRWGGRSRSNGRRLYRQHDGRIFHRARNQAVPRDQFPCEDVHQPASRALGSWRWRRCSHQVESERKLAHAPLAVRMRPTSLDEYVGQQKAVGPGSWLRSAIEHDVLSSVILYGPAVRKDDARAHHRRSYEKRIRRGFRCNGNGEGSSSRDRGCRAPSDVLR